MSAPNYLFYKRGEVRHGEQELVHYKRRFTIADIVLTEEFFVTRKDTFGRGKCFWLAINEVYYKRGCTERSLRFSSVQSLDRLDRRGNMRDDSAEILFQSFLQEAFVSRFGMGKYVHSLMLSIQHFFCQPRASSTL